MYNQDSFKTSVAPAVQQQQQPQQQSYIQPFCLLGRRVAHEITNPRTPSTHRQQPVRHQSHNDDVFRRCNCVTRLGVSACATAPPGRTQNHRHANGRVCLRLYLNTLRTVEMRGIGH
eukprot:GHVU01010223.1.p1 GENE.GHVU01010223.1~~GHVU01010223.1.p1  ORF type:complete len:117 (+),score=5.76 GHVU01010223.1:365-715(+)